MKEIRTLVEDIYTLFDTGADEVNEEALHELGENIKENIRRRFKETKKEPVKPDLRMSNLGTKDRKLWYIMNTPPEESSKEFDPPTKIKFLYGDILEELLLFLCKQAGHTVEGAQDECSIEGVLGHRDAKIDNVVIDVKTASGYGFKKFQTGALARGDDPFGYIAQISGYQKADTTANQDEVGFLAINKESGEICLLEIDTIDLIDPVKRIHDVKNFVSKPQPPEEKCYDPIPDGTSGNMILQKPCAQWCPFRDKCWSNLRFFKYSNEVKAFTHISKEPRVEEVFP